MWRPSLLAISLLMLGSCAERVADAPPGIVFPTHDADGPQPQALLTGTLRLDDECLYVESHGERWLGLWPRSLRAAFHDGRLVLLDGDAVVASVGGPVVVGGGERSPDEMGGTEAFDAWIDGFVRGTIPERCGDLVWQVSGIE